MRVIQWVPCQRSGEELSFGGLCCLVALKNLMTLLWFLVIMFIAPAGNPASGHFFHDLSVYCGYAASAVFKSRRVRGDRHVYASLRIVSRAAGTFTIALLGLMVTVYFLSPLSRSTISQM